MSVTLTLSPSQRIWTQIWKLDILRLELVSRVETFGNQYCFKLLLSEIEAQCIAGLLVWENNWSQRLVEGHFIDLWLAKHPITCNYSFMSTLVLLKWLTYFIVFKLNCWGFHDTFSKIFFFCIEQKLCLHINLSQAGPQVAEKRKWKGLKQIQNKQTKHSYTDL